MGVKLATLNPTPAQRRYLYRVGCALGLLLTVYGVMNDNAVAAWTVLLSALLGLADGNVTTTPSVPSAPRPAAPDTVDPVPTEVDPATGTPPAPSLP